MTQKAVLGKWRIISMELWSQDFVDAEMAAYIEFLAEGTGEFHFGYVHGYMNCHYSSNGAEVDFSWEGNDEMDEASGDGDAVVENGALSGNLIFDNDEESEFKAVRFA